MRSGLISTRAVAAVIATALLASPLPKVGATPARAEGGLVTVLKDGLYGGATGLLLGAVVALVVDSKHRDDSVRWGIVLGTFAGCAYGIYDVSTSEFSLRPIEGDDPLAGAIDPAHARIVSGEPHGATLAFPRDGMERESSGPELHASASRGIFSSGLAPCGIPVALGARGATVGS